MKDLQKKNRRPRLISIDKNLEKQCQKMIDEKKDKNRAYSFSDYVNDLIKKDIITFNNAQEYLQEQEEEINEEDLTKEEKNKYNKNRQIILTYKKLDEVKRDIFYAYKQEKEKIKNFLFDRIVTNIDALLTNHELIKDLLMQEMYKELKIIKECLVNKNELDLIKLCNLNEQEEKYMIHSLRARGRDDLAEKYLEQRKWY